MGGRTNMRGTIYWRRARGDSRPGIVAGDSPSCRCGVFRVVRTLISLLSDHRVRISNSAAVRRDPPGYGQMSMSTQDQGRHGSPGIPTRILVTGSDLLSGALASALETRGFATMHIAPNVPEIERGIEWKPDLVLFDVRSFDLATGCVVHRAFLPSRPTGLRHRRSRRRRSTGPHGCESGPWRSSTDGNRSSTCS